MDVEQVFSDLLEEKIIDLNYEDKWYAFLETLSVEEGTSSDENPVSEENEKPGYAKDQDREDAVEDVRVLAWDMLLNVPGSGTYPYIRIYAGKFIDAFYVYADVDERSQMRKQAFLYNLAVVPDVMAQMDIDDPNWMKGPR